MCGRASTRSCSCGTSGDRIYHVDCKDTRLRHRQRPRGALGSHLPWADPRRGWDFVSTGHGDVPWEDCFRMLNTIGYDRPDLDRVGGAHPVPQLTGGLCHSLVVYDEPRRCRGQGGPQLRDEWRRAIGAPAAPAFLLE